ncbi:MAG: quinone-dependent dihydroorotate dehydrogenase [Rhodospirillales bacterium]
MPDPYRLAWPLLRLIDPEAAHRLTVAALKAGLVPHPPPPADDPILATTLWGLAFANPIGLAAGFDKNAEVADRMLAQGFGFVEVGTVTPRPQPGNPRPRLFRLEADRAVINRLGFNNQGLAAVAGRLAARRRRGRSGLVGANVGPNRDSADPAGDCAAGVAALAGLVDYLVINVSSPNTPGLRALQGRDALAALLDRALAARAAAAAQPPLLVKIAPDLAAGELRDIAAAALAAGIDGLIATNTTIARPSGLAGRHRGEAGGLSGRPLLAPSTAVLAQLYRLTEGRLPLIGVGGVAGGADAYAKIRAGASLVQLYTALVYEGPRLVARTGRELARLLRADGLASVAEAVGRDVR